MDGEIQHIRRGFGMKCPSCDAKLILFKILKDDGTIESKYMHPEILKKCEYTKDGTEINIVDTQLFNRFNQIIEEEQNKNLFKKLYQKVRKYFKSRRKWNIKKL